MLITIINLLYFNNNETRSKARSHKKNSRSIKSTKPTDNKIHKKVQKKIPSKERVFAEKAEEIFSNTTNKISLPKEDVKTIINIMEEWRDTFGNNVLVGNDTISEETIATHFILEGISSLISPSIMVNDTHLYIKQKASQVVESNIKAINNTKRSFNEDEYLEIKTLYPQWVKQVVISINPLDEKNESTGTISNAIFHELFDRYELLMEGRSKKDLLQLLVVDAQVANEKSVELNLTDDFTINVMYYIICAKKNSSDIVHDLIVNLSEKSFHSLLKINGYNNIKFQTLSSSEYSYKKIAGYTAITLASAALLAYGVGKKLEKIDGDSRWAKIRNKMVGHLNSFAQFVDSKGAYLASTRAGTFVKNSIDKVKGFFRKKAKEEKEEEFLPYYQRAKKLYYGDEKYAKIEAEKEHAYDEKMKAHDKKIRANEEFDKTPEGKVWKAKYTESI